MKNVSMMKLKNKDWQKKNVRKKNVSMMRLKYTDLQKRNDNTKNNCKD